MRTVHVGTARLERWVAGFGSRHPGTTAAGFSDRIRLSAPDGSSAVLHAVFGPLDRPEGARTGMIAEETTRDAPAPVTPFPLAPTPPDRDQAGPRTSGSWSAEPADVAQLLVADAGSVPVLRALLVRRGGYACAVVDGDAIRASKVGSRYVQGRTAAGGWSQQRFARRRAGQADALVGSVIEVAARVLLPAGPDDALVTGGDRPLLEQVLADPRLRPLTDLRRGPHLEVGDPKIDLVRELSEQARAVRIELDER